MAYYMHPGDLVRLAGAEWQPEFRDLLGLVTKQYKTVFDNLDEDPRWQVMTIRGPVVVFAEEVDVVQDADGEDYADAHPCSWGPGSVEGEEVHG